MLPQLPRTSSRPRGSLAGLEGTSTVHRSKAEAATNYEGVMLRTRVQGREGVTNRLNGRRSKSSTLADVEVHQAFSMAVVHH